MSKIDQVPSKNQSFLKKMMGNVFLKNVALLMSGTAGAQLLGLMLMPVITRLFDSSQFGIAATFQSVLVILCIVSNLRYELAIPLAETEEDAQTLFVFNIGVLAVFTLLMTFFIFLLGEKTILLLDLTELLPYLWLLPIAILFLGLYQIFTYWGIRHKLYKILAKTKITQVLSMLLIQMAGYKLGTISLIVGQSVGQGIGGFQLAKHAVSSINSISYLTLNIFSFKSTICFFFLRARILISEN